MKKLLAAFGLCFLLLACGPEDSNLDKETEQMDQLYQKNKEILSAIAGDYSGTIEGIDGSKLRACLRLRSFSIFMPSPNRMELIEIPNLLGFVTFRGNENSTVNFSQGNYDKRTSTLRLYGTSEIDGAFYFMEVRYDGKNMAGEYLQRRMTSKVLLTKTDGQKIDTDFCSNL